MRVRKAVAVHWFKKAWQWRWGVRVHRFSRWTTLDCRLGPMCILAGDLVVESGKAGAQ